MEHVKLKLRTMSKKRKVFTVEKLGIFLSIVQNQDQNLKFPCKEIQRPSEREIQIHGIYLVFEPGLSGCDS